jgi:hypothetical protein
MYIGALAPIAHRCSPEAPLPGRVGYKCCRVGNTDAPPLKWGGGIRGWDGGCKKLTALERVESIASYLTRR